MPRFKTNENIFDNLEEYFLEEWFESSELVLPDTFIWDKFYTRPTTVKDVEIWEVLCENSQLGNGFFGVYAAWKPYADLFIITENKKIIAQYLGKDSLDKVNTFLESKKLHPVVRYNESIAPIYVSVRK